MQKITIYTGPVCPKCRELKQWLKKNKIAFIEKNAWKHEKLLLYDNNMMYVPVLEINGKFYDKYEKLKDIIKDSIEPKKNKLFTIELNGDENEIDQGLAIIMEDTSMLYGNNHIYSGITWNQIKKLEKTKVRFIILEEE